MATETKNGKKEGGKAKKDLTPAEKKALREKRKAEKKAEREAKAASLVPFRETVPSDHLNADGLLTTADIASLGFDADKHKPLEAEDFASEDLWMRVRARELRARGEELIRRSEKLEKQADTHAQFGDPKKRAAVKRLQKVAGALAELTEKLKADGVDVESLLAAMGGTPE